MARLKYKNGDNWEDLLIKTKVLRGGSDPTYSELPDKPQINNITLVDNKSSNELGLQEKIDNSHKLDADLVADGTTNKVFTSTEKTKLNGIEAGAQVNTVNSVNSKTGSVVLSAGDVGAEPTISTKNTAFNKNFETSTSNIKMNGSVSVGSSDTLARADHIHPSDTSKQNVIDLNNKLSADYLSDGTTNKVYTATEQSKLNGIESGAEVNDVNSVNGKTGDVVLSASDVGALSSNTSIPTKTSDLTNDSGYITNSVGNLTNYYTKTEIDSTISSVYKPAGSVAFASLPSLSSSVLGNVYNVTDAFTTTSNFVEGANKSHPAGTNVVVVNTGTSSSPVYKFDVLSGFVDLSGYVPTSRKVNNKALSSDITLSASDVSAQPVIDSSHKLSADLVADGTTNKVFSATEKTKLNGIQSGAQVNTLTGVKGNSESSYRTGDVNITPANIGVSLTTTSGSEVVNVGSSSLNVMTRNTAQFVSGTKTFNSDIRIKNISSTYSATPSSPTSSILYLTDSNNNYVSNINATVGSSWNAMNFQLKNKSGTTKTIEYVASGSNWAITPVGGDVNLGSSSRKWKDLYLSGSIQSGAGKVAGYVETSSSNFTTAAILNTVYPVGSIRLSINPNEENFLGGTWIKVSQGRALFGAGTLNGNTYTADGTKNAGLPNITGEGNFSAKGFPNSEKTGWVGALNYKESATTGYFTPGDDSTPRIRGISFDASLSNSIYGNSTTVQPNAYVVYVYKRTA